MEMTKFIEKLKSCKATAYDTGDYNYKDEIKVYSYTDTYKEIRMDKFCKKCNHVEINSGIMVTFKVPHKFTIFECGLIVFMYAHNLIPRDYAQYHETKAGQEFIENLDIVEVI